MKAWLGKMLLINNSFCLQITFKGILRTGEFDIRSRVLDSLDIPLQKGLSCPVCRHQGMDNFCVKTKEPNNTTPITLKTCRIHYFLAFLYLAR